LELDAHGWASLDALVDGLRREPEWGALTVGDVDAMVACDSKRRHQLQSGRIRALYGHSVPRRIEVAVGVPPEVLFHGTSPLAWEAIRVQGLVPMGRQYVHLSTDVTTAVQVGRRKSNSPMALRVHARVAAEQGACFWRANEVVWLADVVSAEFLDAEFTNED
jgi:putative RNA 2'-phosphotransferase